MRALIASSVEEPIDEVVDSARLNALSVLRNRRSVARELTAEQRAEISRLSQGAHSENVGHYQKGR